MKRLIGLELTNYVFYDHAKFRLDHPGITVVYGRNINAGKDSGNSNESGKSLLVSALPQLRYDAAPINTEAKAKGKKDSWDKGTSVRLVVRDTQTDTAYEVTKTRSGASFTYDLVRNGKHAKTRTSDYFYQKLSTEILPWSETDFYTRIYLDSRRPAALQLGSPVQRLEFFSEIWHLDHIDSQRKLVKQYLDELRDSQLIKSEVADQVAAVTAELDALPADEDLSQQKAKYEKLLRRQRKLLNTQATLRAALGLMSDYAKIKEYGTTSEELLAWLDKSKGRMKKLKRQIAAAREWATYQEQAAIVGKKRSKYTAELLTLQPTTWFKKNHTPQQIADIWDANRQRLLELKGEVKTLKTEAEQSELEKLQARLTRSLDKMGAESAAAWLEHHGYTADEDGHAAVATALAEHQEDLVGLRREADKQAKALANYEALFSKKESCTCDACHQEVSTEFQDTMLTTLRTSLRKLTRRDIPSTELVVSDLEVVVDTCHLESVVAAEVKASKRRKKLLAETTAEFEQLAEGYESSKRSIELADKLSELEELTPPESDEEDVSLDDLVAKYEKMLTLVATVELVATHADTCKEVEDEYGTELGEALESIDASLTALDESLRRMRDELAEAETTSRLRAKGNQQLAALQERLEGLDSGEDDDVVAALYDALGNKNLKTLLVQRLAAHLQTNMNRHAPLLFREPIEFEFIVEANNFHILYHRTYTSGTRTSDVRTLSGAGSRAFNFLLALSLIPLTPDSNRCNVMIMDEPCVNLDEAFTEKFCNEFLPKLVSVVESVIVISPTPLDIPATRTVCVVKEGGASRLVELDKTKGATHA